MEFNQDGDLLATGDKGGRVVIFQVDIGSVFILLTDWGVGDRVDIFLKYKGNVLSTWR